MAIGTIVVVDLLVIGLAYAVVTLPRWFARSLYRHRLWRFRDQLADDILSERLPRHPAVLDLFASANVAIREVNNVSLVHLFAFRRHRARLSAEARAALTRAAADPHLDGLNPVQAARVERCRAHLVDLVAGTLLLGSWAGVLTVLALYPKALRTTQQRKRHASEAMKAATTAATHTRLGRATVDAALATGWHDRESALV